METKPSTPLILIIDDEEALRDGCRQVLERSGYNVLTAADGQEGVRIARESKPDMAFVDFKMPNISGMEIIEILSKDIPDIVLVMITGYATIVSAVEAIRKGAYDYLPKPFNPDQLRALTTRGIDHRKLKIEARKLREEKEQIERNYITFVSHEMRSPLVVILQYMESIKMIAGDRLDKDVMDIIDKCVIRAQRLEELINHWLDLSRIEDGSFAREKVALNLSQIVMRSVDELSPVSRKRGISLETDLSNHLPTIIGDEESLVRVFTNLIGNATKYTPDGGKISISITYDDYYITVKISDTGIGIPHDKLPFIFDPFFRVKGKDERHKGSGLGLTFCKKIMESHNGSIDVESTEGKGTTFLLKFPTQAPTS
jgi:two-component system, sensor histidine kinase and response regulator